MRVLITYEQRHHLYSDAVEDLLRRCRPHILVMSVPLEELKVIEIDESAQSFIDEASTGEQIHIIANERQAGAERDYSSKEKEQREHTCIPRMLRFSFWR